MLTPDEANNVSQRAGNVLELLAKLVTGLATVTLFLEKIVKPWRARQRTAQGAFMRSVLAPELEMIARAQTGTDQCAIQLRKIGEELDLFLELALDNRDRHDETNELLDAAGLAGGERRTGDERRQRVNDLIATLNERRRQRTRRSTDI